MFSHRFHRHYLRIALKGFSVERSVSKIGGKKKIRVKQQRIHSSNELVGYIENISNVKGNSSGTLGEQYKSLLHEIKVNPMQMLGFSVENISARMDMFHSAGITQKDSVALSLSIPSCLNINNSNFKKVLKLLQKYNLHSAKLLYSYPCIGSVDYRLLRRNLQILETLKLNDELSSIILENPILLVYPINKNSFEILKKTHFELSESTISKENLIMPLKEPAIEFKDGHNILEKAESVVTNLEDVKEFLKDYDLDLDQIYQIAPSFLFTSVTVLEESLNVVLSQPFCLNATEVESLMMNYPDVFLAFAQKDIIAVIEFIQKVAITKDRLYKLLLNEPEIFRDPVTFFRRVKILQKHKIKDSNIGRLLAQKGGSSVLTDCEDFTDHSLEEILKFYLSGKDITPMQIVMSAPVSISLRNWPIVKARMSYMRFLEKMKDVAPRKKSKSNKLTLQTIIRSNKKEFVELICKSEIINYEEFCRGESLKCL